MNSDKVILRNSERKLFKECQWKWEREYVDRLKPRRGESTALWFGTGIHLALEKYYIPGVERGTDPRETWRQYVLDSDADMRYVNTSDALGNFDEAVEAMELGEDMLTGYLELYGDEEWMEVIATEFDFQVSIEYDRFDGEMSKEKAVVVGSIDLIYRDTRTGKIWLADHKTARALGSQNTQFLPMDDQAGLYLAVAEKALKHKEIIGEEDKVAGIVFNYLVKSKSDPRPRNEDGLCTNKPTKAHYLAQLDGDEAELKKLKVAELEALAEKQGKTVFGEVSKTQPPKRFDRVEVRRSPARNRKQVLRLIEDLTAMGLVRYNVLRATKTTGTHCGYCPFLEICQMDEEGSDWSSLAEEIFVKWDPYETHREELKE